MCDNGVTIEEAVNKLRNAIYHVNICTTKWWIKLNVSESTHTNFTNMKGNPVHLR